MSFNSVFKSLVHRDHINTHLNTHLVVLVIFSYLLLPYKILNFPISLTTLFVFLGLLLQFNVCKKTWENSVPPIEKKILGATLGLLFFAWIIQHNPLTLSGQISYIMSFLTFIYIRLVINEKNMITLHKGFIYYIYASAFLILLEIWIGSAAFLSNLLIAENQKTIGFRYGSGFAPYASLTGGLLLWPLVSLIAKYSASKNDVNIATSQTSTLFLIFAGTIGLFYTLARASWVALLCGCTVIFIACVWKKLSIKKIALSIATILFAFYTLIVIVPKSLYYTHAIGERITLATSFFSGRTNNSFQNDFEGSKEPDASVNTRLHLYKFALIQISSTPVFGIGIDQFPKAYEIYFNSLSAEDKKNMDPTPRLDAHNFILTYLVENGILAGACFLFLIAYYIFRGFSRSYNVYGFAFLSSFISICIWMIFTGFIKERIFWIALAAIASSSFEQASKNTKMEYNS